MPKNKKEPEVQFVFVPWESVSVPWTEVEKEKLWNLILTALNRMTSAEIEKHLKNIREVCHEQKAVGRSS